MYDDYNYDEDYSDYDDYDDEEREDDMTPPDIIASMDEAKDWLRKYLANQSSDYGIHYAIVMNEDGVLKGYIRNDQPCYGELRTYGENSTRPQDRKPSDLHHPFPDGNPVLLGVKLMTSGRKDVSLNNDLFTYVFQSPTSPWHKITQGVELFSGDKPYINGVIFTDMDVDSTALVHCIRMMRACATYASSFAYVKKWLPNVTEQEAFIISTFIKTYNNSVVDKRFFINTDNYTGWAGIGPNIKRLFDGDFIDLTGGTFFNRWAYNRPEIDFIFGKREFNVYAGKLKMKGGYVYHNALTDLPLLADHILASR